MIKAIAIGSVLIANVIVYTVIWGLALFLFHVGGMNGDTLNNMLYFLIGAGVAFTYDAVEKEWRYGKVRNSIY